MEEQFHPVVFALISYGIAPIIAVIVTFLIKAMAALVREKKPAELRNPNLRIRQDITYVLFRILPGHLYLYPQ